MLMASAKSPAAKYIDRLERQARSARPLTGWQPHWGGAFLGAGSGFFVGLWLSMREPPAGAVHWPTLLLVTLVGAVAFAVAGRLGWNALLARHQAALLAQVRSNLLDHELLLLCFEPELPAHYEKLRHAAQSYGKTRARNWAELRKGSMQDRVQWLIENYQVICGIIKLPYSTPGVNKLRSITSWLFLVPVLLIALPILVLAQGWLPRPIATDAILLSLAGTNGLISVLIGVLALLSQLERSALLTVLVEQLDVDGLVPPATGTALGDRDEAIVEIRRAAEAVPPAVN
jgi:hypothetical protein